MPEPGGLLDQASNTIDCLQLVFEELDTYRQEQMDKSQKKHAESR